MDCWLGREFPASPGSNQLEYSSTDGRELEVLPVINGDGRVVIMVANHAVNDPMTDNNGPGAPRRVRLDVSALGTFSAGSPLLIDAKSSAADGPTAAPVTLAAQMMVSLGGMAWSF